MTGTVPGSPAPNRVCKLAQIDIPIIQAPMTYIAGAQLAAAVSNAGALGIIETTSEQGRADLQRVRDLTDGPVGANIALLFNRDPAVVDLLAANDIRFVTTSAGDPSLLTDRLHDAGIIVFHVVGTLASARKAVDAGVDGLVVEGVEGGGFKNRFGASTMVLLPLVAAHVDVPIVAAGGICDARSMAAAFVLGAEGVQMGTRLLASADSPVHGNLKQAVVRADETSTVLLPLDGKRMMRVIRTPAADKIDASASFSESGAALQRVQRLYFEGDMAASVANTGQVAGRIEGIPPAAEIIKQMWTGCRDVLASDSGSTRAFPRRLKPLGPSGRTDGSALSAQSCQRRIVIGFLRDFWHQFRVGDVAVCVNHHDGAGKKPCHRTVSDGDAVVFAEAVPERRRRRDVLDALRAAESLLRERQIFRHTHHGHTASGGALVEGPHARRAYRCVHGRKDVQQHGLTAELLAADRAQVSAGQFEAGGRRSDGRQFADSVDRVSAQGYLCHVHSLPRRAGPLWVRSVMS